LSNREKKVLLKAEKHRKKVWGKIFVSRSRISAQASERNTPELVRKIPSPESCTRMQSEKRRRAKWKSAAMPKKKFANGNSSGRNFNANRRTARVG